MTIETKRRLAALVGYPVTYLFEYFDKTDADKKETLDNRKLFKARILGRELSDTVASD